MPISYKIIIRNHKYFLGNVNQDLSKKKFYLISDIVSESSNLIYY
jgi:hypothetical protein